MRIFNKKEFVEFVRNNEYLYIDNNIVDGEDDNFDYDLKIVNDVFDGNGIYGLVFGSRGEVEFRKIDNFVEDLIEWNSVSKEENEFRDIVDIDSNNSDDYLDLNWEEELSISYFLIIDEVK